jgi:hypothetical protein
MNLGTVALIAGKLAASRPLFTEALRIAHQIDDRVQLSYVLDALGCHAAGSGQARLAAQLLGAADTVRAGAGNRVMPFLAPQLAQAEALAIAALGASRFEAERKAGSRLSRDEACGLPSANRAGLPSRRRIGRARGCSRSVRRRLHSWSPTA